MVRKNKEQKFLSRAGIFGSEREKPGPEYLARTGKKIGIRAPKTRAENRRARAGLKIAGLKNPGGWAGPVAIPGPK